MKPIVLWPLAVGAAVALVLVIAGVSLSASGFELDMERWLLIGGFLVVIAMATAVVVAALNALKEAREDAAAEGAADRS